MLNDLYIIWMSHTGNVQQEGTLKTMNSTGDTSKTEIQKETKEQVNVSTIPFTHQTVHIQDKYPNRTGKGPKLKQTKIKIQNTRRKACVDIEKVPNELPGIFKSFVVSKILK